jgi:glycogen synthase
MRVLMSADTVGGIWNYAVDLTRALVALGHEVILAALGEPHPDQAKGVLALPGIEFYARPFRLEWMEDPWEDVQACGEWLLRLEDRAGPDIVHLNSYSLASLPWESPVVVTGHSCVLSWWEAVRGCEAPAIWNRYRAEVRRGLQAAALVTAPSGAMLERLEFHYGPFSQSRVILNGRDGRPFVPAKKEPIVFSAGRIWDEAKNIAMLERIAGDLPWPLFLAGECSLPGASKKPRKEPAGACHLGRLTEADLAQWVGRASIYALPARYEPFGLSVLEAALAGCCLVLGDIPSLREIWQDAAIFVDPGCDDALREAICELIDDPEQLTALALQARKRALALDSEAMARGYLQAYRDAIGFAGGRGSGRGGPGRRGSAFE